MAEPSSIRSSQYSHSRMPSFSTASTAYNGADGHIDILSLDDDALASTGDTYCSSPTKESFSARPALSTRLQSSLPTAQTAAAALTRSKTILHSRAKSLAAWTSSFTPPDKPAVTTNRIFGDLFSGESAPIRLGVPASPIKEESEFVMEYRPTFTQRPSLARRQSNTTTASQPTRQGWFSRKSIAPARPQTASSDELLDLSINNALFPDGPADPLSPHAFNDLLLNATRLLERMQSAYREKVDYIASIQPELDAQREETEEADTRAQHLKMQLEDMGRRAQEQETAMRQMATQLAEEKIRAQEARDIANTIRVVDDDTTPRRRKRGSAGSASDSGFESDWDRDTESVVSSGIPTPRTPPASFVAPQMFDQYDKRNTRFPRQMVLRPSNLSHGRNSNEAIISLNVLNQLKDDNQHLRRQLDDMQLSLQGCIEYVDEIQI